MFVRSTTIETRNHDFPAGTFRSMMVEPRDGFALTRRRMEAGT